MRHTIRRTEKKKGMELEVHADKCFACEAGLSIDSDDLPPGACPVCGLAPLPDFYARVQLRRGEAEVFLDVSTCPGCPLKLKALVKMIEKDERLAAEVTPAFDEAVRLGFPPMGTIVQIAMLAEGARVALADAEARQAAGAPEAAEPPAPDETAKPKRRKKAPAK